MQEVSRRTLRVTFRALPKQFELVSVERLGMTTPAQPGIVPEVGLHGGNWIELRDSENAVLAHRLVSPSLFNSIEVHSPDGVHAEFGGTEGQLFEVLLPDVPGALSVAILGDFLPQDTEVSAGSRELARFQLPSPSPDDDNGSE